MAYIYLYRAEHSGSRDRYTGDQGIITAPRPGRPISFSPPRGRHRTNWWKNDVRSALIDQGRRGNRKPTGFISTIERDYWRVVRIAESWVKQGKTSVVLHTIRIPKNRQYPRVDFRRLVGLRYYLGLRSPYYMEGEVVVLNRIPAEYIVHTRRFN